MGYQAWCVVTDWPPAVAAYRAAGGMDFYWSADQPTDLDTPTLPYTVERDCWGGWAFQAAEFFYESLRPHLPDTLREPADGFLELIYPDSCGGEWINDLETDAGIASDGRGGPWYAMRPSTAERAVARGDAVPWEEVRAVGEAAADQLYTSERHLPEVHSFLAIVDFHHRCLREAVDTGRGAFLVVSY